MSVETNLERNFGLTVFSTTIKKTPNEGIFFRRLVCIPPVELKDLRLVVAQHLIKTLYVSFSLEFVPCDHWGGILLVPLNKCGLLMMTVDES